MSDPLSNDRTGLCTFIFADGRHCSMPQSRNKSRLCYFHAKEKQRRLKTELAGLKVGHFLNCEVITSCDLNAAFTMLFRCAAQGYISPKSTNALTKLGNLMLKTHLLAKEEYLSAYEAEWSEIVQDSSVFNPNRGVETAAQLPIIQPDPSPEGAQPQQKPAETAHPVAAQNHDPGKDAENLEDPEDLEELEDDEEEIEEVQEEEEEEEGEEEDAVHEEDKTTPKQPNVLAITYLTHRGENGNLDLP